MTRIDSPPARRKVLKIAGKAFSFPVAIARGFRPRRPAKFDTVRRRLSRRPPGFRFFKRAPGSLAQDFAGRGAGRGFLIAHGS